MSDNPAGKGKGGGGKGGGGGGGKGNRRGKGKGGGGRGGGGGGGGRGGGGGADAPPQDPAIVAMGSGPPPPMPAAGQGATFNDPAIVAMGSGSLPPGMPAAPGPAKANPISRTSSTTRAHMTEVTFASLPLSDKTKRAVLEVLRYELLTQVQAQTLPLALEGKDLIAKAKTGTGKTVGFLLPTIERLARVTAQGGATGVLALAISPTRELASQILEECNQLMTFHKPQLTAHVVFGGTNIKSDLRALTGSGRPPSLLVATPGRLNDLLYNHGCDALFANLTTLIFDEADQLLEMGFRPDITKILNKLAEVGATAARRQTLLFSATMPADVLGVAKFAMRSDATMVDTVGAEVSTADAVEQSATVTSMAAQPAELLALMAQLMTGDDYKVVVFFVTARLTQLYAELFNALGLRVLEMHSRKSQPQRTRVADEFRDGKKLVMFSSDVSARGMDYPDVTAVVQVGLPSDKAQYIHRLGRTARAGKSGGGYLVLADFEDFFLNELRDLPLQKRPPLAPEAVAALAPKLRQGFAALPSVTLGCGYQAWLGFYNSHLRKLRWSQTQLVANANEFSREVLGLATPPPLEAKTVGKMGLKGVPGLNVEKGPSGGGGKGGGGGGGGGKGGGKGGGRGGGGGGRGAQ